MLRSSAGRSSIRHVVTGLALLSMLRPVVIVEELLACGGESVVVFGIEDVDSW